jgi:hypothetical protein
MRFRGAAVAPWGIERGGLAQGERVGVVSRQGGGIVRVEIDALRATADARREGALREFAALT